MHNLSKYSHNGQSQKQGDAIEVPARVVVDFSLTLKSFELIKSVSSDCGGSSRASAGTFSSSDNPAISNSHTFDLIGMHGSTVIATRGLSSEGMNLFSGLAMNDIHCVAGINLFDLMPANRKALQGIDNHQAFIKEDDFRMNKNQVESGTDNQTPCNSADGVNESVIHDVDRDQGANRKESQEGHKDSTFGSEYFKVGHHVILSCTERRAA